MRFRIMNMAKLIAKQLPLRIKTGIKTDVRAQFAALCWRVKNDQVQVCLVTSRSRKRWIIPKGWPIHDRTPANTAAIEAYEEAGLSGEVSDVCIGIYTHSTPAKVGNAPILTMVYPLHVSHIHSEWPEAKERRRKWFSLRKAAKKLSEPELRKIVDSFNAKRITR